VSKQKFELILNGLKTRLGDANLLTVQSSDGHLFDMSCIFYDPINEEMLSSYVQLPDDYKNFLRLHNGANFFVWEYGTTFSIYSLQEALSVLEKVKTGEYVPYEYKDNWFPIGYVQDIGGLYIDCSTDKSHVVLMGIPIYALLCDFPTWLDRMIRVNGEKYWEWVSKEL